MEQVQSLVKKLRCVPEVKEKAAEYFRLAELKRTAGLQPSCLAAICVELACRELGEVADKKEFQRFSGLQMKYYRSSYQVIEKLLDVKSQNSLRDLAIRFGYPEIESPAKEVLSCYQRHIETKYTPAQHEAINFTSPLYSSAALYTALKLLKIRCDKNEFVMAASTSKANFNSVHEEMMKTAPKTLSTAGHPKAKKSRKEDTEDVEDIEHKSEDDEDDLDISSRLQKESFEGCCLSNPLRNEYIAWKERIISDASSMVT